MTLPVGTVIKYIDYPHGKDGVIKPYWFVIMGRTSVFDEPQIYFMFKITSRIQYYEKTIGDRRLNVHKIIECKNYTFFDCDCCIDYDFAVISKHNVDEIKALINSGKIEVKGRLDPILSELYNLSLKGSGTSFKIKEMLHSSFILDGIDKVNKPQPHNKDYFRNKYNR